MNTYKIDWNYIDDDGFVRTETTEEFETLESASRAYRQYIRLQHTGWYDLVRIDGNTLTTLTMGE